MKEKFDKQLHWKDIFKIIANLYNKYDENFIYRFFLDNTDKPKILLDDHLIYEKDKLIYKNLLLESFYITRKEIENIIQYIKKSSKNKKNNHKISLDELIIKCFEEIKNFIKNDLNDFIVLLQGRIKSNYIIFYDLETTLTDKKIILWSFFIIDIINKKVYLALAYNKELKELNKIYFNIFKKIKKIKNKKIRKNFDIYLNEINIIKENILKKEPLLSWFNIIWFDNKVLWLDYDEKSLDLYEFLTLQNDKWKLDLLARNNLSFWKLMTHEDLLKYLDINHLISNPDDFYKLIIYNIIDAFLTLKLFFHFMKNTNIRLITKNSTNIQFLDYIEKKWKKQ